LKNSYKTRWFAETGALYRIEVSILKDQVTLTIDTSGTGLHRRGYRDWIGVAPLKETMAAGLIYLSRWRNDRPLVDPFCGSGTIPIEAALIGKNIAPGMNREFAAEDWPAIPREIWHNARAETHGLANFAQKVEILGTDIDGEIIKIAERNAEEADLAADIKFRRVAIKDLHLASDYGVLIANPPYGERISEQSEVDQIYRVLGEKYRAYRTWSYFILTANEQFEKFFGAQASKKRKLYNGNIKVDYYQYYGPLPSFKKLGSGGEN
jgi:putative N6-adenine-specific DNA methylase